jgi:prevent-host-death family protein
MTKQVNLYEAKTHLSRLVEEAAKGDEIIIAKNDRPLARLVPLAKTRRAGKRKLGGSNHRFEEVVSRKDADAQIEQEFEDRTLWPGT